MIKRCLLYVLSFALLSTGLSTLYSSDANAWTTNPLPACELDSSVLGWNWQADIKDTYPDYNLGGSYIFYRNAGELSDTSKIYVDSQSASNDPLGFMRVWYLPQDEFGWLARAQAGNWTTVITATDTSTSAPTDGSMSIRDATCISYLQNPHYVTTADLSTGYLAWSGIPSSAAWEASSLPEDPIGGGESGVRPACEAWDFGCYVGRLTDTVGDFFSGVGDTFADLATALVTGIGALFIPDSAVMQNAWQGLVDSFTAQLGFLLAPFDFILSVGNHVVDDPQTTCTIFGGGVTLLGSTSSMDICQLDEQMPLLFGFLRTLAQAGIFLWLASEFTKKYHEVVRA